MVGRSQTVAAQRTNRQGRAAHKTDEHDRRQLHTPLTCTRTGDENRSDWPTAESRDVYAAISLDVDEVTTKICTHVWLCYFYRAAPPPHLCFLSFALQRSHFSLSDAATHARSTSALCAFEFHCIHANIPRLLFCALRLLRDLSQHRSPFSCGFGWLRCAVLRAGAALECFVSFLPLLSLPIVCPPAARGNSDRALCLTADRSNGGGGGRAAER